MSTTTTLDPCELLKQADKAWFELRMGGTIRSVVDQNGERIEYTSASSSSLLNLIAVLQSQCSCYQSIALGGSGRGPLGFVF